MGDHDIMEPPTKRGNVVRSAKVHTVSQENAPYSALDVKGHRRSGVSGMRGRRLRPQIAERVVSVATKDPTPAAITAHAWRVGGYGGHLGEKP